MKNTEHAMATFEDATRRYQGLAPDLEAAAELSAVQFLATAALEFAPDATHMLIESSDQGDYMCAPHALQRDGQELLLAGTSREQEWEGLVDQYDLNAPASWLTWGHDSWERFIDTAHPYTNKRAGYLAIDLRKIRSSL